MAFAWRCVSITCTTKKRITSVRSTVNIISNIDFYAENWPRRNEIQVRQVIMMRAVGPLFVDFGDGRRHMCDFSSLLFVEVS